MRSKKPLAAEQSWRVAGAMNDAILANADNAVWSPACVTKLLSITRDGSAGKTRRELDKLLGRDTFIGESDPFALGKSESGSYAKYVASEATAVWLSTLARTSPFFLRACKDGAIDVRHVDFANDSVGSDISTWISRQTHGLLRPSISVKPDDRACLVSAIYLRDAWSYPFDSSCTTVDTFHSRHGDVQAAFMHNEGSYSVAEDRDGLACADFLSSGEMVAFAMPKPGREHDFDPLPLFRKFARGRCKTEEVKLGLPRFECATTLEDMASIFEAAGIETAQMMDLRPMVGEDGTPTECVHGAKIVVDEEGIEAGAYTMLDVPAGSAFVEPPKPREITFDRPFAFSVISTSGAPLFLGWVDTPSGDVHVWEVLDCDSADSDFLYGEEIAGRCRITMLRSLGLGDCVLSIDFYGTDRAIRIPCRNRNGHEVFEEMKVELMEFANSMDADEFDSERWVEEFANRWKVISEKPREICERSDD